MFEIRIGNPRSMVAFWLFFFDFVDLMPWKLYFLRINCDLCSDRSLHEIHFKSTELNNNFTDPFKEKQKNYNERAEHTQRKR